MNFKPHDYQKTAIEFIKTHDRCALFLDMGLGKTVSTLTALNDLSGRFMSGKVGEKDNSLEWGKRYVICSRKNGKSKITYESAKRKTANLILPSTANRFSPKFENGKSNFTKTANLISPSEGKSVFTFPCLVIAPKRVALTTWTDEVRKWDHLKHLDVVSAAGLTPAKRGKVLKEDHDIYVINVDVVPWLVDFLGSKWPFNTVVLDELSLFKSPSSKRFKSLKKVIRQSKRVIGLTGTLLPNGYEDLYSQIYLLDGGERLGRTLTAYRERFFVPDKVNYQTGTVYSRKLRSPDCKDKIDNAISDICLSMKAKDFLNMPPLTINNISLTLDPKTLKQYKELEKEYILEVDTENITAQSAASVNMKLAQLANGAVYSESGEVVHIHDVKIDALKELVETSTGNILIFYEFKHDFDRIVDVFKSLKPRKLETSQDLKDWNDGNIKLALCHPKSAGHGLNLQAGGNIIVWFGLPWSLELYQQANARLYRQGQTNGVIVHQLIVKDTVDVDKVEVLESKEDRQEAFLKAFKRRVEGTL